MNSEERHERIAQIEKTIAKLQEKGWRMEKVTHTDEDGESFRTIVTLTVDPKSTNGVL